MEFVGGDGYESAKGDGDAEADGFGASRSAQSDGRSDGCYGRRVGRGRGGGVGWTDRGRCADSDEFEREWPNALRKQRVADLSELSETRTVGANAVPICSAVPAVLAADAVSESQTETDGAEPVPVRAVPEQWQSISGSGTSILLILIDTIFSFAQRFCGSPN